MAAGERTKQVLAGVATITGFSGLLVLIAAGRFLPGLGGEFFARILGIISTPFLMEFILAAMGLVLILTINHWRQRREGDELVYLDELPRPGDVAPSARMTAADEPAAAVEIPSPAGGDTHPEPHAIRRRTN